MTVKDLSAIESFDGLKLSTVLPYDENKALYKILLEATTTLDLSSMSEEQIKVQAEALSISALSDFKIANVRLATAMPSINPTLEKMIKQITKNDDFSKIKISNLSGEIFVDNVDLSIMLGDYESNKNLYNILLEASGKDANKQNAEALKASALSSFNLSLIKLSTAITEPTGNVIIDTLRADNEVNLGNIGMKINGLKLYDVFGSTCFTTVEADKVDGTHQFKLENGAYVHLSEEEAEDYHGDIYYIHKNDGIWLFICFEFGEINTTGDDKGRPNEYRISSNTLGDLMKTNEGDNNFMSTALTKATLRQLMDAGIIKNVNTNLYNYTIEKLINAVNNLPDGVLGQFFN